LIQNASDSGIDRLVFFLFDLLHLDGEDLMAAPLLERK
jgi:ATP-dependent DNA ligase